MKDFSKLAQKQTVEETINNLKPRGINTFFVQTGEEAKKKVLEIIPQGVRVLASASVTLETTGIKNEIDDSGKFISVRKEYMSFDHKKEADRIRVSRSTPDFIIGSVHAVTEKGEVMIASNTGSQLAAYVYGAGKVIWVVGTQKVVKNIDMGFERIYEYSLPLESERLKKIFGVESSVSKVLIYNKEPFPNRTTLIFVNEILGY